MIKVTFLYYRPDDPEAFEKYYMEKHMPIALQLPGVRKVEAGRVIRGPKDPDYFWCSACYFDSPEDMKAAFASPAGAAAGQDVANFAPKGNVTLISEVK